MNGNKKILILVCAMGIGVLVFLFKGQTEINVNDSYKNHPILTDKFVESSRTLSIELGNKISFDCVIMFDHTNEIIKLNNISIRNVDRRYGESSSINVSAMRVPHFGSTQAQQLNFNLSSSSLLSNEVGSCLIKITTNDSVIVYSKTDNIKVKN